MNAAAFDTTELDRVRGAKVKDRLLRDMARRGVRIYSPRCPICRGRIDITVDRWDTAGQVTASHAQCRTPECLSWNT